MPLIAYADLHGQTHPWVGRPEMRDDAEFACVQIAEAANTYEADVIDVGDTYHVPRPEGRIVEIVQKMIHDIVERGHQFAHVYGNHSHFPLATSPELSGRIYHLSDGAQVLIGGLQVAGYDHMSRTRVQEALPNIPLDVEAIACHWSFEEAFRWGTHQLCLNDVPSHIKLCLAGHIHQKIEHNSSDGEQTLLYPGSPYMSTLSDGEDGGIWHIGDNQVRSHMPLMKRQVIREQVEEQDDIERIISEVRAAQEHAREKTLPDRWGESISQPIVVVKWYIDELPGAGATIARALAGVGHVFEYPMDRASVVRVKEMEEAGELSRSKLQLPQFLPQEVDAEEDPVLFDTLNCFLGGATVQQAMRTAGSACGLGVAELDRLIPMSTE